MIRQQIQQEVKEALRHQTWSLEGRTVPGTWDPNQHTVSVMIPNPHQGGIAPEDRQLRLNNVDVPRDLQGFMIPLASLLGREVSVGLTFKGGDLGFPMITHLLPTDWKDQSAQTTNNTKERQAGALNGILGSLPLKIPVVVPPSISIPTVKVLSGVLSPARIPGIALESAYLGLVRRYQRNTTPGINPNAGR